MSRLKDAPWDYLGNLDADVSFGENYYERLFGFFEEDRGLGIAGGRFYEIGTNGKRHPITNSSGQRTWSGANVSEEVL